MTSAYTALIQEIGSHYDLPADLLTAQIEIESAGYADAFRYEEAFYTKYIKTNPTALGFKFGPLAACSYGLLQILLETALEIGYTDRPERLFDPRVGLAWGAKYLRQLWDTQGGREDTYRVALARYNGAGPAADLYATKIYQAAGRRV